MSTESLVIEAYETDQTQTYSIIDLKKDKETNLKTEQVEVIKYTILIMGKLQIVKRINSIVFIDKVISALLGIILSALFKKVT